MTEGVADADAAIEDMNIMEEPGHLDEQLDDGDATKEAVDAGGTPSDQQGTSSGVEEALRAWEAGGHVAEELGDADEILPVQFAQLEVTEPPPAKPRNARLNNVYVDITVELGRKEMTVQELTKLKEQEVIELNKLAGESFDIMVNQRPFAEGEIVVITDMMAVRITRLHDHSAPEDEFE